MVEKTVTLRCDDGAEAVVFTKYDYESKNISERIMEDIDYEISVEDSYIGGDYKGFFGRLKRAWQAFIDKPVMYTGIYTQDKEKMRKFLQDCLNLIDKESIEEAKHIYRQMNGNASTNTVEI